MGEGMTEREERAARVAKRQEWATSVGVRGSRKAAAARAMALVAQAGDYVRSRIAGDADFIRSYVDMLKYGASREVMDRTCINIVNAILKLQGEERKLVVEFVNSIGVQDEAELRRIVDQYRGAEGADVVTAIERCTTFLEGALPMHEAHRAVVVRRLGGVLPYTGVEEAVEAPDVPRGA